MKRKMQQINYFLNEGPAPYRSHKFSGSGFVILFAVVFSAILLAVGLGVANVAYKEINFTTSAKASNDSFLAADTGIECALLNDKLNYNAFSNPGTTTVACLGESITANYDEDSLTWEFIVPPPAGQNYCAKVTVTKEETIDYTKTDIISKGYNLGGEECDNSSPNLVERQLNVTYTEGVTITTDNFTEDDGDPTDTLLEDHDPTGAFNTGSGWVAVNGSLTNKRLGDNVTDTIVAEDQKNRYKMNDDLNSDVMTVEADFTYTPLNTNGTYISFGVLGRMPATGAGLMKGGYDHSNRLWTITDEATTAYSAAEENWTPGVTKNIRLEIRYGYAELYVDDIFKVTWDYTPNTLLANNRYAGIFIDNDNQPAGQVTIDDYESRGY